VLIDTTFDFRVDSKGQDPDFASPALKHYHKFLWTKPLPSGEIFNLIESPKGKYLVYESEKELHQLTSDSIVNSYASRKNPPPVIKQISEELILDFLALNSTIGGFILFPGNKINEAPTINQERGTNPLIADRFDLTLECINRFYKNEDSPLSSTLRRYESFFRLFMNFKSYVDFFLLNDLVSSEYSEVLYFNKIPKIFEASPIPKTSLDYLEYCENSMQFTQKRNSRIQKFTESVRS
jgi:hypothetical protein